MRNDISSCCSVVPDSCFKCASIYLIHVFCGLNLFSYNIKTLISNNIIIFAYEIKFL